MFTGLFLLLLPFKHGLTDLTWLIALRSLLVMTEQPRPTPSPRTSFTDNSSKDKEYNNPGLRQRGPARTATTTFAEDLNSTSVLRRNSTLSDSVSEARNSIRSSTDDLFLPRVSRRTNGVDLQEESHWQSAPLGLALFPAIAGVFFKNGSAVVTDITLLVLAAIFLNWSVRLPWYVLLSCISSFYLLTIFRDWYRSAQAVRQDKYYEAEEESDDDQATLGNTREKSPSNTETRKELHRASAIANAANRELQIHELAALASCFIFPMIGTWLLHTIRSKLSRPSEGLVSNYNLTIFLLASEIRPFAHLLRMVQARTLHLQRTVHSASHYEEDRIDASKIADLSKRLEELEIHIAEAAAARLSSEQSPQNQPESPKQENDKNQILVSQTTAEIQKAIQPEIDALNRAVRRYEKRTAVTSYETDSRFRDLETQVRDAVSLAAAAHRSGDRYRNRGFAFRLIEWIYAAMLIPVQILMSLTALPFRVVTRCLDYLKGLTGKSTPSSSKRSKGKMPQNQASQSPRRFKKATQSLPDGTSLRPIREYS